MAQIFTWARNSCTSDASLAKLHSHTAPQQSGRAQKWASADDLPDSRGVTEVLVAGLVGAWNFPSSTKRRRRLWHVGPGLYLSAYVKMLTTSIIHSAESLNITSLRNEWSDKTNRYTVEIITHKKIITIHCLS